MFYFEIFSYPLTLEELRYFSQAPIGRAAYLDDKLQEWIQQGQVFQFGEFYQTRNEPSWVKQRLESNRRALQFIPLAHRMARFIGRFPFVRAVCVSGSLSKNAMGPASDIDFFVVTEPGRLWLARTLLVVFKKIFLFNSHKYFCVNYFIDKQHLEIAEKNLFTATETVTLLPMYGREEYAAFRQANAWAWHRLPNFPQRSTEHVPLHRNGGFKGLLEYCLSGRLGAWLDEKAMRLTVSYWKRKFSHFDSTVFNVAMKSRRYVSKHHPLHFQQKVMEKYEKRLAGQG